MPAREEGRRPVAWQSGGDARGCSIFGDVPMEQKRWPQHSSKMNTASKNSTSAGKPATPILLATAHTCATNTPIEFELYGKGGSGVGSRHYKPRQGRARPPSTTAPRSTRRACGGLATAPNIQVHGHLLNHHCDCSRDNYKDRWRDNCKEAHLLQPHNVRWPRHSTRKTCYVRPPPVSAIALLPMHESSHRREEIWGREE